VLGAVPALRRPATTSRTVATREDRAALEAAFDGARRELDRLAARAQELAIGADAAFLEAYRVILSDARLRELAFEELERGESVPKALGTVARTATRAASLRGDGDAFLKERARDIEDLCDALVMLASPDARAAVPTGAVLVGDDLGVFDLLVTRRFRPSGLALSERVLDEHGGLRPRVHVLAELLGVPTVVGVKGLFEWVSPGDLALLDADHGIVVVNPPRTDIAAVRAARKKLAERPSKPEA
jgi:phosphotransferase system enzyme I (PtsP)